jgi:hypothetical protein
MEVTKETGGLMEVDNVNLKWIKGYEGLYAASRSGDIFSMYTKGGKGEISNKLKPLKDSSPPSRYKTVHVYKDKKRKTLSVHRVIAELFIENPDSKPQVNHIDGSKKNAHADNLEWVTMSENMKHAIDNKLTPKPPIKRKLSDEQVVAIIKSDLTKKELASKYSVDRSVISRIKNGLSYVHLFKMVNNGSAATKRNS